ncbi:MAG: mercury methylation corrinoid protein HgcA [Pirellulaceae bacterium]
MDARHQNRCCCGSQKTSLGECIHPAELTASDGRSSEPEAAWADDHATPAADRVPRISTALGWSDHFGHCKVRWAIGRRSYRVEPGLYAVGTPTAEAPVLVSANYKMSFDRLRGELEGIDAWILVLETDGVNVWCAAGKGTFGTNELVQRINATDLSRVVNHDRVIVPQLGAPGVCAGEVRKRSGFRVVYGPVQAKDIPAFLEAGMKATPRMRRVDFPFWERLAVVPVELMLSGKYVLIIMLGFLILAGLGPNGYSLGRAAGEGLTSALLFGVTFVVGTVLTPALLPWLPGRALSVKGLWIGVALTLLLGGWTLAFSGITPSWLDAAAWCLLIPVTTSVAGMNFTGATTYTSLSGVRREMRIAVPIQVAVAVVGVILWVSGRFV